jgi:hypothetical protein
MGTAFQNSSELVGDGALARGDDGGGDEGGNDSAPLAEGTTPTSGSESTGISGVLTSTGHPTQPSDIIDCPHAESLNLLQMVSHFRLALTRL